MAAEEQSAIEVIAKSKWGFFGTSPGRLMDESGVDEIYRLLAIDKRKISSARYQENKHLYGWGSANDACLIPGTWSDTDSFVLLSNLSRNPSNRTVDYQALSEAIADLDSLNAEAKENDLPEPDARAIDNARTMLPLLYNILSVRYRVSPTERRGVSIDAPMKHGAAVAVECAPNDIVYCFASIGGNGRRAKFYQMDELPDVFIVKALRDLAAS